ncbi:hypothetical protein VHUM_03160 [Vanrija humicola]|uniref:Isochorismatase-like domain-containing protein n=1 Tax=Vanrija humicola TaxID=5417 RepID=A0A7D8YXV2_VANHU|nr:hypothetical protein VHUM_03160 [Vanrija humicola]
MPTAVHTPHSALLIIDVQVNVVAEAYEREQTIENINTALSRARAAGAPVVWVQHSEDGLERGSDGWAIVPELLPHEGELHVYKTYGDAFEDTDLEAQLDAKDVRTLVVCGAQTDFCVRSTIHSGLTRGFNVTLVGDAHTTDDLSGYGAPTPNRVVAHTNMYWAGQRAPGRKAAVVNAAEVEFV